MNRMDIGICIAMEGLLSHYLQRIKNLKESEEHDSIDHTLSCSAWDKLMEFEPILKKIEKDISKYED